MSVCRDISMARERARTGIVAAVIDRAAAESKHVGNSTRVVDFAIRCRLALLGQAGARRLEATEATLTG